MYEHPSCHPSSLALFMTSFEMITLLVNTLFFQIPALAL